jgi:hypothetical protein
MRDEIRLSKRPGWLEVRTMQGAFYMMRARDVTSVSARARGRSLIVCSDGDRIFLSVPAERVGDMVAAALAAERA